MVRFPLNSFADHLRAQATRPHQGRSQESSKALVDAYESRSRGMLPATAPHEARDSGLRDAWAQAPRGQVRAAWERAAGPDGRINPW